MISSEKRPKSTNDLPDQKFNSLVLRYVSGDKSVFEEMYSDVTRIMGNLVSANPYLNFKAPYIDIYQECWITFLKKVEKWEPERGSARTFLFKCFSSRLKDIYMKTPQILSFVGSEIEDFSEDEDVESQTVDTIDITLKSRFRDWRSVYILRRAVVGCILGIEKQRLLRELRELTGYNSRKVLLLVNYSTVKLRMRVLELT